MADPLETNEKGSERSSNFRPFQLHPEADRQIIDLLTAIGLPVIIADVTEEDSSKTADTLSQLLETEEARQLPPELIPEESIPTDATLLTYARALKILK